MKKEISLACLLSKFRHHASTASTVSVLALCLAFSGSAFAQQPVATLTSAPASAADAKPAITATAVKGGDDDRYRIGPGDVLDIRVFNRPTLSREAVRVDGRGLIRMPLIEEEIAAACRTEGELAKEIATRYLKYQRSPNIDVFVKEYNSQPVAVVGAVNQPGRFQLQRRMRLLDLISFAGGPNDRAGGRINIVRTVATVSCDTLTATPVSATTASTTPQPASLMGDDANNLIALDLNNTLRGGDAANPFVQPGDYISLPEAAQIFVVGNIFRPTAIAIKDQPITISTAIAMAGGTLPDTKKSKVRIVRQVPGSTSKTEIIVNLDDIGKRRAEDIALQANDIVEVPTSSGKKILRGLIGAIVPTATQLPIQVIR